MWVLKTHTKTDKMNDLCQNIRQDFDIYWNIDHQKAKKLNGEKNKTHTQTSEQPTKQPKKQRNGHNNQPTNQQTSFVFVWSDVRVGAIACGQAIQIKRQHASNHANQHKS